MEIINLTHNDDLFSIARKCNANFKQLAYAADQSMKKQSRLDNDANAEALNEAVYNVINVSVPNEVSAQLSAANIPGQISNEVSAQLAAANIPSQVSNEVSIQLAAADIPAMVSDEVTSQMPTLFPPIGSYVMSATSPDTSYAGTTWSQVDTITTTGSLTIPLWQRTA